MQEDICVRILQARSEDYYDFYKNQKMIGHENNPVSRSGNIPITGVTDSSAIQDSIDAEMQRVQAAGQQIRELINNRSNFINQAFPMELMATWVQQMLSGDINEQQDMELEIQRFAIGISDMFITNGITITKTSFKNLEAQLRNVVEELAEQMRSGGESIDDIQSTITINGVDMSFNEFAQMTDIMRETHIFWEDMELIPGDRNLHNAIASIGVARAKINHLAETTLSEEVATFLRSHFDSRIERTVTEYNKQAVRRSRIESERSNMLGRNNSNEIYQRYMPYNRYGIFQGTEKEEILRLFSQIDMTSEESFQETFENAMTRLQNIQNQFVGEDFEVRNLLLRENTELFFEKLSKEDGILRGIMELDN